MREGRAHACVIINQLVPSEPSVPTVPAASTVACWRKALSSGNTCSKALAVMKASVTRGRRPLSLWMSSEKGQAARL